MKSRRILPLRGYISMPYGEKDREAFIKNVMEDYRKSMAVPGNRHEKPEEGFFCNDMLRITSILSLTPNRNMRDNEVILWWICGRIVYRLCSELKPEDKIYFQTNGTPADWGGIKSLSYKELNEFLSQPMSLDIRPCDYMDIQDKLEKKLQSLFDWE